MSRADTTFTDMRCGESPGPAAQAGKYQHGPRLSLRPVSGQHEASKYIHANVIERGYFDRRAESHAADTQYGTNYSILAQWKKEFD